MPVSFSEFAAQVGIESAFSVLAVARRLKAAGKRVIELEIGDSPFPATQSAKCAAIDAIRADQSHYAPSIGLAELREAAAAYMRVEHGVSVTAENIIIGAGAKIFEQLFCEAFLNPGDGVLVFSPYFPTYLPNIQRRGARAWLADLRSQDRFRPRIDEVERFLNSDPRPKAIFLNSPHNPTGGVATAEDLRASPTWCVAATWPSSATSPMTRWSGAESTRRHLSSRTCWINAWPRTRSASRTA